MPIQAPNEKPAIQHARASGLMVCAQSSAEAVSESSPAPWSNEPWLRPQHREAAVHERVVHLVDDRVVHVAAELRVRVQHHGDRGVLLFRRMVAALKAACGTGENDFRHHDLGLAGPEAGPARNRQSPQQVVQAIGGRACQKRSRVLTWGEGQKASIANMPPA
jgi:hypothetical protein